MKGISSSSREVSESVRELTLLASEWEEESADLYHGWSDGRYDA